MHDYLNYKQYYALKSKQRFVKTKSLCTRLFLVCTVDNLFQKFKIQGPELITYQNLFLGRLKKFNEINNLV